MFRTHEIQKPYLIFLGDIAHPKDGKTGLGLADWRREWCVGQMRLVGCGCDAGISEMTISEAISVGAKTFIVGGSPIGGKLPDTWIPTILEAINAGLNVVSGLHSRLVDIPAIAEAADLCGVRIHDVRAPIQSFECGDGRRRSGKRILTVGTSTCVGKKYTALAIEKALKSCEVNADFRATGQTGLLIAERGVVIDAVIADFISGAAEYLSPEADENHWDVIEGQGSLFHPAYAGVTLGLIHGSQPDFMVLCHKQERGAKFLSREYVEEFIESHVRAARLTNPDPKFLGISINLSSYPKLEALEILSITEDECGLPCVDPFLTGVDTILPAASGQQSRKAFK